MAKSTLDKAKEGLKEFGLTSLAVDNHVSIFFLTFMLMLFGLMSYNDTPKESYPEIIMPKIFINTLYPGNSAADIESLITRHLEKEIASISIIDKITSNSMQDYSIITAEFGTDVTVDEATQKIKDAVDKAKSELPNDLPKDPEVLDVNFSELPIMTVNLSGNFPNDVLRSYAEYLQDDLENIKEISSVDLKGTMDFEVAINVNPTKMESMQVSFGDIENAIRSENMTMSGGEIVTNDFRRSIRVIGQFSNMKQIENMIVKSESQHPVYLKDIATVTLGFEDRTSIARSDKLPVVSLDVIKRAGENLLEASDKIKVIVAQAQKDVFPKELKVSVFNDQSVQTRDMVSNLENSIISGVLLVVIVLLFFLGIRNAMFVGMAIPLSMLIGIMVMGFMDYTMNMVVLFALILALGMLVDNAIVVVENIYRYMQLGYSSKDAAKYGTGEVAMPIIASTATTLAAFVPLAFWPGLMGSFMRYLPITLIVVLSSSLFVALVINPVLTASYMKVDGKVDDKTVRRRKRRNILIFALIGLLIAIGAHFSGVLWLRNILALVIIVSLVNFFALRDMSFYFQNKILPILENGYDRFIRMALNKFAPYVIFAGTFVLLFFAIFLLATNTPKVKYFPEADPLFVNAFIEMPMGTDIEGTNQTMREIENEIYEVIEPYKGIIEAVLAQIGENTSDPAGPPSFGSSPNLARLTVSFVPSQDRGEISSQKVMEEIRVALSDYVGVQIVVDRDQNGPPTGKPINIEIKGDEINELSLLSQKMIDYLNQKSIAGVDELQKDVKLGKPELLINVDRESARRYGISTYAIADAIRTSVYGKEISKFKEKDDDYPIMVRVAKKYRNNIDAILGQKITFRNPKGQIAQVPMSAVAKISYSSTYSSINRKDQDRVITVYSNILDGYNANEVVAEVDDALLDFDLPKGYSYEFTGEQQEQEEAMDFMIGAFMAALFGIFIIIVAQFNSFISPFIIILSVLFSTIGVFLGYVFTGMDLVIVMTGVGIISLAGIVVNNAIVLVDYTNLLLKRKRESLGLETIYDMKKEDVRQAVIEGGATRLRPVLLTAITTVLGLIPLAIGFNINFFTLITDLDPQVFIGGDNAAFWGTMAWTVIYGLVFATFLTLVVVPVMYWLAFSLNSLFKKGWKGNTENDDTEIAFAFDSDGGGDSGDD